MLSEANRLGAIVAIFLYVTSILVFTSRLVGRPQWGHGIGYLQFLAVIPLGYLLVRAPDLGRAPLYYIQVGLMLAFLLVELLLDYTLKLDFRHVRWMVIGYVMLFFAGTGGMLGVAAMAGREWSILAVVLFLVMAVLTFVQRAVTGM